MRTPLVRLHVEDVPAATYLKLENLQPISSFKIRDPGHPVDVEYRPSFVDGAGSHRVLDSMWPLVSGLVDQALAIPVEDVAAAGA